MKHATELTFRVGESVGFKVGESVGFKVGESVGFRVGSGTLGSKSVGDSVGFCK